MCQKKAVIIGGSNGIGLAISKKLLDYGYDLEICDRIAPEEGVLEETKVTYHFCDLMKICIRNLHRIRMLRF